MSNKGIKEEKKESFIDKMKNDKKYSAKVQLFGWFIFVAILVIGLNLSSISGNNSSDNNMLGNMNVGNDEDDLTVKSNDLLKKVRDNYSYSVVINIDRKSMNVDTNEEVIVEEVIHYSGKSYGNKLEIKKEVRGISILYYKVDNNYYSMIDNITSNVGENVVYDVIDGNYIELNSILNLINKSSLDYVTEFSSGKKESLYRLKVKDIIGEFNNEAVIEFNTIEENGVLNIIIDYSNFFRVNNNSIDGCKVNITVTEVGKIEDFEVLVSDFEESIKN